MGSLYSKATTSAVDHSGDHAQADHSCWHDSNDSPAVADQGREADAASVPYVPPSELCAYTNFTLSQHWMGRTRGSIHPDYRAAFDTIALVPEILERSGSLVAMQRLDARLVAAPIPPNTHTAVVWAFTARCNLPRHVALSLWSLVQFAARYGWSKYVVAALRDLTDRCATDETIAITMYEVTEFMKMCDVAKMEAFAKVLDLVAADDDAVAHSDAVVAAILRLRAPLLKAMRTWRDRVFETVFLKPADFVLRANGGSDHRQRADDLRVHGSNMYRALLLSTLGINAWDAPDMDDPSHFAVDFLSYLSPSASPLATWWDPTIPARRAPATTRITSHVDLGAAFIVQGDRPDGHVANHLIGPSSSPAERRRAAAYVSAYAAFSAGTAQSAEDRRLVLTALRHRGVATDADDAWTTLVYDDDYALRRDKVLALFQFLGVYKCPTAGKCAPMAGVALTSAYKP
ncbi:hypothetical protein SPRG_03327 [Saprolegnia parasitica CBS 223.65]|uniref:Uncharacterized protein n=1 Tax=Saprolegnia parasitica (strain CBS 223.65) TaxID=695850 RepID=A0A067CN33_SAPPC|nr:hypothetical protein SPRG_03327 [Saprolegnia parasitica CBS 223.65]KDO32109.1 hypothetical protein SPRG_03327 [Saprolegnia parasitica CBS 223.65]|eukprot:XP_012197294.1 hypothetical protein SPRG_03327 [Saprolegnia parasitica CBS 223.65]